MPASPFLAEASARAHRRPSFTGAFKKISPLVSRGNDLAVDDLPRAGEAESKSARIRESDDSDGEEKTLDSREDQTRVGGG